MRYSFLLLLYKNKINKKKKNKNFIKKRKKIYWIKENRVICHLLLCKSDNKEEEKQTKQSKIIKKR